MIFSKKNTNKKVKILPSNIYEFIVATSILSIISIELYLKYISNSFGYKSFIFFIVCLIVIFLMSLLIIKSLKKK